MGIALVMTGANFADSKIIGVNDELYALIENAYTVGYGISRSPSYQDLHLYPEANTKRACVWNVDISDYLNLGYSKIKFYFNQGTKNIVCNGQSANEIIVPSSWAWGSNTEFELNLTTGNTFLAINLRNSDDSDISDSTELSHFLVGVELL